MTTNNFHEGGDSILSGSSGEDSIECFIGIDPDGRRWLSLSEMKGWATYTLTNLKRSQVDEIMSIPWGDMDAIQALLSKYY